MEPLDSGVHEHMTHEEKAALSCGFYDLIEVVGPKATVGIRTYLPLMGRTAAIRRRSLGNLAGQ